MTTQNAISEYLNDDDVVDLLQHEFAQVDEDNWNEWWVFSRNFYPANSHEEVLAAFDYKFGWRDALNDQQVLAITVHYLIESGCFLPMGDARPIPWYEPPKYLHLLVEDVRIARQLEFEHGATGQFYRRVYVRTFVTLMEAVTIDVLSHAKRHLSNIKAESSHQAKRIELERTRVNRILKNGSTLFERVLYSIRYMATLTAEGLNLIKYDCKPLREFIGFRNNITHPSTVEGIILNDGEMDVVHQAANWYLGAFDACTGYRLNEPGTSDRRHAE